MSKNYLFKENVVLLANGDFPKHEAAIEKLNNSTYIICCDGSANSLVQFGKTPDIIIGDLDSIDDKIKNEYIEKVISIKNQKDNDLRKALDWICSNIYLNTLYILGSTGLREDHTMGNLTTFLYKKFQFEIQILTDTGIFHIINHYKDIKSFSGQYISIFCIDPNQRISTTGLKYELNNSTLQNLYSGTLNIANENKITIKTKSENPLLLYLAY